MRNRGILSVSQSSRTRHDNGTFLQGSSHIAAGLVRTHSLPVTYLYWSMLIWERIQTCSPALDEIGFATLVIANNLIIIRMSVEQIFRRFLMANGFSGKADTYTSLLI